MSQVTPIIKWAGGKRQLLPVLKSMLPKEFNTYYEPFFGGGALFCDLQPAKSVINDLNIGLIRMYEYIKRDAQGVCRELSCLQAEYNSKVDMTEKDEVYYTYRNEFNEYLKGDKIYDCRFAALFIFINKMCFNGLYRVNKRGLYNVPSSHKKKANVYDEANIKSMSELLKNTKMTSGDFEDCCMNTDKNDFVFFDSPYYDTYDSYQVGGFSEEDHIRLSELFKRLSDRGAYCMLTNSNSEFIKDLYKDFNILTIDVKRMINCDASARTGTEIIVTNYEKRLSVIH